MEREVHRGGELGRIVDERHPDRAPEPRGFDHEPSVFGASGERGHLAPDARAVGLPAGVADLPPVDDGDPQPAAHPFEQGLVHAERRRGHPGTRVCEASRLEQRLDRAVLAERSVEADDDDRRGILRSETVDGGPDLDRTIRAKGSGVVVGGSCSLVAAMVGRQPPPATIEVDEDLADGRPAVGECPGDGRPGHDRYVMLGRRPAEQDHDRWKVPGTQAGHGQPSQSPTNSTS